MTDQELKDLVASLAVAQAKTDQELKEFVASLGVAQAKTDAQLAKTDAQLAKTDAQLAKTDKQLARTDAKLNRLAEMNGATDAKLDRLAEMNGATDAKLNRLAEMHGGASNNQGAVAEEFFFNTLSHKPVVLGIAYDYADKNLTRRQGTTQDEFDIILTNGSHILLVEVKYKAHPSDLDRLLIKKAPNFRKLFPQYKDFKLRLALAAFSIDDDLVQLALKSGVIVLQRKGDLIETAAA